LEQQKDLLPIDGILEVSWPREEKIEYNALICISLKDRTQYIKEFLDKGLKPNGYMRGYPFLDLGRHLVPHFLKINSA